MALQTPTPTEKFVTAAEIRKIAFDEEFGKVHDKIVQMLKTKPAEDAIIKTSSPKVYDPSGELGFVFKFKEECIAKWVELGFKAELVKDKYSEDSGLYNRVLIVKM